MARGFDNLSPRARAVLKTATGKESLTLKEIGKTNMAEVAAIDGCGPMTLDEIICTLKNSRTNSPSWDCSKVSRAIRTNAGKRSRGFPRAKFH